MKMLGRFKMRKSILIQRLGLLIIAISVLYPIGLADQVIVYFTLYPGLLITLLGYKIEIKESKNKSN